MPKKTKEAEKIPVKNTKKDAKTSDTKVTTNSTKVKSVSNSRPSGAKTKKTTKTDKVSKTTKQSKSNKIKTSTIKKPSKKDLISIIEYYDLPYRYNQTIVKVLAQTPSMLFVYWDISDTDKKNFEEYYGTDFFNKTKPVLIIHNKTMNYSFEIEINDFANSWYLHINDANCKYIIELGRRPFTHNLPINTDYIYISSSNEMTSQNNHILFEKFNTNVAYKNTITGHVFKKDFTNFSSLKNMQTIYNIYDFYKTIYKDNLFYEITNEDLTNPSSLSSSNFK